MKKNAAIYDTVFRDYGKSALTLREKLDKEGISRYKLASLSDTKYEIITKYYKGDVKRIDLDILARICFVLDCEISDILRYERPSDR